MTSGLLLNTSVAGAMLIFPQVKVKQTSNLISQNNLENCDRKDSVKVTTPPVDKSIIKMIFSIFRRPTIVILFVNAFLFYGGLSIVFTHTVAYAITLGHTQDFAVLLMSLIGLSNFFGRIFLGFAGQNRRVNITVLYFVALSLAGR